MTGWRHRGGSPLDHCEGPQESERSAGTRILVAPEQREGIEVNIDKPPAGLSSRPRSTAHAWSDCITFTRLDAGKQAVCRRRRGYHARVTRWRRCFAIGLALASLCAAAWIEREALLRGAADLWIVSDPVTPADAVVVLGGGIDMRPFVAADLYTNFGYRG
jgi:hypothetical protein